MSDTWERAIARTSRCVALAAFCVLAFSIPVAAQYVRGMVRDSASNEPIAGAVITLRDSLGHSLSQTVTGGTGRFAAPIVGRVRRLTLVRIGFHPVSIRLALAVPGTDTTVSLAMAALPTLLASVDVIDQPDCKRRDDRAAAFALWEQARTALLATIVARKAAPPAIASIRYDRRSDSDGRRILSQTIRHETEESNRPFIAARPPEEFSDVGYVAAIGNDAMYYAPDADGLLDPAFAASHCFSLNVGDSRHPGQLGLAFDPMRERDSIVDIGGTIWIDTTARELRTIEFKYDHLPNAGWAAGRGGGSVEFRTASGVAVIDRWNLHVPEVQRIVARTMFDLGASRARVAAFHDIGAEITSAEWPDGTQWAVPLPEVRGTVTSTLDGKPIPNVLVWLGGTDDSARTAVDGSFRLPRIFPGPYSVFAADSIVSPTGRVENAPRRIEVDSETLNVPLQIPPIEAFVRQTCDSLGVHTRKSPEALSVFVLGRIALRDGNPASDASFDARILGNPLYDGVRQSGRADSDGLFQLCYLPPSGPLSIATTYDSGNLAQKDTVALPAGGFAFLRIVLDHPQHRAP